MSTETIILILITAFMIVFNTCFFVINILDRKRSDIRQYRNEEYLRNILRENRKNDSYYDGMAQKRGFSDDYDEIPLNLRRLYNEISRLRFEIKKINDLDASQLNTQKLVDEIIKNTSSELLKVIENGSFANNLIQEFVNELSFEHFKELKYSNLDSKLNNTYKTIQHIQHIIRTPLSGIKICIQTLLENNKVANKEDVDILKQMGTSINLIESNLKVLSSYQTDDEEMSDLSFKERLNSYINLLLLTSDKKISLNLEGVDNEIIIPRNVNEVMLCIACIIENAVSFAPDNSEILINCNRSENKYTFNIANYGSTISEDIGDEIFKDGFSSRGSTGIGLNLAYRIVHEKLNGTIGYKNIVNPEGVEFYFTLEDIQ